jgi:hypothetical protein
MNTLDFDARPRVEELQGVLRTAVDAIRAVPPPDTDCDAWQGQSFTRMADSAPPAAAVLPGKRKVLWQLVALVAGVAALIAVCFGTWNFTSHSPSTNAFAETIAQIQQAKTITWKATDYKHATSRDGKRTWMVTETASHAFQPPSLWRYADDDFISVEDRVQGKSTTLWLKKKQAVIKTRQPIAMNQAVGPFQQFQKMLQDGNLQWLETRTLPAGDVVNVFRNTERDEDNKCDRCYDLWIDARTKRLVEINLHGPRGQLYDPQRDPIRDNPPGNDASSWPLMGCVWHDIVFDAKVDNSLFTLNPPADYSLKHEQDDRMTEQDMLEYLGVFVEFRERMFPDVALPPYMNLDKLNAALAKPARKLTPVEKKYLDMFEHYHKFRISSPFDFFNGPDVVTNSFRYLGKGVKLGDKDRIVCWYKLKDAKAPSTYRVVYGDLCVKDVAAKDLPLPVDP